MDPIHPRVVSNNFIAVYQATVTLITLNDNSSIISFISQKIYIADSKKYDRNDTVE